MCFPAAVPERPVNVMAWPEGAEAIGVSWKEPDEPNGLLTKYTVVYSTLAGSSSSLVVDGNTSSTVIAGLLPCTNYSVRVSASTAAGEGKESDPVFATTFPAGRFGMRQPQRSCRQWRV